MPSILVVEDSRFDQRMVAELLEDRTELDVEFAQDGVHALRRMERTLPQIVLSDMQMPKMDGLELVKHVRKDYPSIPVILMTAFGSEELAAEALRWGATGYVPKNQLTRFLVPSIERMLALLDDQIELEKAIGCLTRGEWAFTLHNDPQEAQSVLSFLRTEVSRLKLLDECDMMQLGVALDEALNNAIYHGNLEVGMPSYEVDEDDYLALIEQRKQAPPFSSRRVHLSVSVRPSHARFIIRDEGDGFDTSSIPDLDRTDQLGSSLGRGLVLIRSFMDTVEHNACGNEITMIKRVTTDAATRTPSMSPN